MSSILNREDFILNSDSGKFIVKKDELLVGNVRMVHRDERIFDQPHKFLPARFENKVKFYSSLRFEEKWGQMSFGAESKMEYLTSYKNEVG